MITKTEAVALRSGQTIYSGAQTNRDGSPLRVRVTGATKTWKTRPGDFRVPVRYGLRENGEITHRNNAPWYVAESDAIRALGAKLTAEREAKEARESYLAERAEAKRKADSTLTFRELNVGDLFSFAHIDRYSVWEKIGPRTYAEPARVSGAPSVRHQVGTVNAEVTRA